MESLIKEAQGRLEQRRQSLLQLARATSVAAKELLEGEAAHEREGREDREQSAALARLSDRERRELTEIDAALVRIARGSYGKCVQCGGAIGRQRLTALPEARLCMTCSSREEQAA